MIGFSSLCFSCHYKALPCELMTACLIFCLHATIQFNFYSLKTSSLVYEVHVLHDHKKQARITSTCMCLNKFYKVEIQLLLFVQVLFCFFQEEKTEKLFLINFDNVFSFSTSIVFMNIMCILMSAHPSNVTFKTY